MVLRERAQVGKLRTLKGVTSMSDVVVRTRENPQRKRERIARVSRELSLTTLRLHPDDRRAITFGRIVSAGCKAIRPELAEDVSQAVLDTAAATALRIVVELVDGTESGALKARVQDLEEHLAQAQAKPRFTLKEIDRMRTYKEFGSMSYAKIAKYFAGATADDIREAMTGKARRSPAIRLPGAHEPALQITHEQPTDDVPAIQAAE
jgi:hypothetical protein